MRQRITKTTATAYLRGLTTILPRVTMALLANKSQNPDVRYVAMAGCVVVFVDGTRRSADGLHSAISPTVDTKDKLATFHFQDNPKLHKAKGPVVTSVTVHGFLSKVDLVWTRHVNAWPRMASA
ncbi:MAG: hypothetical protein AAFY14_14450 [Pseudomonadota bacterium]